ncbi:glycoside hydrolase family 127 protein [Georgenia sp. TF02-10]|uniref:glycoside hydrolase family 127 protein n=1 Tax=Georgenia sp. TF02-10 TaxID=2917725 RepID=UPI001FA6B74B|nr:beta-L-arabinofuranosidase domain-containing protein [Georgenia sp. TF02-10]UNX55104.1 glycoside hydrolase family 127 protein [Georgenia sp. TF02-10]
MAPTGTLRSRPSPVAAAAAVAAAGTRGTSLGRGRVQLRNGLLAQWQDRNAAATLPHAVREIRRAGNLENFRRLVEPDGTGYRGRYPFLDTDVYKTLEGAAYEIARGAAGEDVVSFYAEAVDLIERAQAPDGYLGTYFQGPDAPKAPWSDLAWGHELYNLGHLVQAAVAARRQLGDDRLLAVARRFADLVVRRFGDDGEAGYCGHPEVEMALVELSRETGEAAYLRQAELFVRRRGSGAITHTVFPPEYFQDAVPLTELDSVTGHAVRMMYLAAGATDVAAETGDAELLDRLVHLWEDMVRTKLYLTGGLGSRHSDEAIGDRYELPAERSYSETCAAIGLMQWAWRLFLLTGRADVLDVYERVLYNAYAVGLSADGTAFFYDNPLQRRPDHSQRSGAESGGELLRRSWFGCPCCPPNVVRWMAQLQDHVAVATDRSLTLALLTGAEISSPALDVVVETDYPWGTSVTVRVTRADAEPTTLAIRVPAAAREPVALVNGAAAGTGPADGWVVLERRWRPGDVVTLSFEMPVTVVGSHPYLDATRGSYALVRGPVVYCVEQQDSPAAVDDLVLRPHELLAQRPTPRRVAPADSQDPLGPGEHDVVEAMLAVAAPPSAELYPEVTEVTATGATAAGAAAADRKVTFIPYFLWGNRDVGAMRVWLRGS